jgi:hypothetical protein
MVIVSNPLYAKVNQFISNQNMNKEFIEIFNTKSLSSLMRNINRFLDQINLTNYELGSNIEDCRKKLKGDIGELFALAWIQTFGSIFGLVNPKLAPRDYVGIDLLSGYVKGGTTTIQVKWWENMNEIESGKLETLYVQASNLRPEKIVIWTTLPKHKISSRYNNFNNTNTIIIDNKDIDKYYKQEGVREQFYQTFKESFC